MVVKEKEFLQGLLQSPHRDSQGRRMETVCGKYSPQSGRGNMAPGME